MFLDKRVNQGATGRVYPNPFTDRLSSESVDHASPRRLPGERLSPADDLPRPGRAHPGGDGQDERLRFRLPPARHQARAHRPDRLVDHRAASSSTGPSTTALPRFMPVDYAHRATTRRQRHRLAERARADRPHQAMVGICLYPDKAYIELKVRLYNRTPFAQTFLWWVNVGVHTHDQYQVVFPPDVTVHHGPLQAGHGLLSHARRRATMASIYTGRGHQLAQQPAREPPRTLPGRPIRTFSAAMTTARDAGVIHVANHHISPGKKMFTWGTGDFGQRLGTQPHRRRRPIHRADGRGLYR